MAHRMAARDVSSSFAPKASGASHLHAATARTALEALVLYSSAAAALGNVGQANYAAANAALDALATRRHAEGLAASSVQLPMVGGVGMGQATMDALPAAGAWSLGLEEYAACLAQMVRCGSAAQGISM